MPSISIDSNNDIRSTYEKNSKPLERIASLDFQRGLAIFLMIFVHGAANIIDYSYIEEDPTIVGELPIPIILIFVVLAFFAVWNSYFLLISVSVNSYVMARGVENGKEPEKILLKQTLTGFGLLLVNMVHQSFMATGYFGVAIITGDWSNTYPLWNGFFNMGTLRIIGLSLIINSLILYFLLRNYGYKKFFRNIMILGILALVFIVPSQFIHNWIDGLNWLVPESIPIGTEFSFNNIWPNVEFQALNSSFKSWACSLIAGDVMPVFPYFGTAFIGAIIGLCLVKPEKIKRFPLIGGLSGVAIIGLGVLLVFLTSFTFGTTRPPIGNYLFMLGGQLCTLFLLLWLVEYHGKSQKFGNNPVVKHFRLWGMVSLTLFTLDILDLFPRWLFGIFYNLIFSTDIRTVSGHVFGQGQEHIALLYALASLLFFEIIILLWSRVNFFLSFEWCIVCFVGLITGKPSRRLDVESIMNKVKWINYKEIVQKPTDVVLYEKERKMIH